MDKKDRHSKEILSIFLLEILLQVVPPSNKF